jgi:TP901 family phage tail tape measure protein
MGIERYGLGAIITADDKPFVSATDRARDSLGRFVAMGGRVPASMAQMSASVSNAVAVMRQGAAQMATGVQQLGGGIRNIAIGMLPLTLAVGSGFKQAALFEKQMSAVGAITRANEKDMGRLTDEAKRMGIVSVFTATQAGEAMEYLGRAGANADEIIASLQGTMAAAAADSIDLATAANIVAQVVKSMNLQWSEASHVADVLALTSASTNTDITALGESFKYGSAMAKGLDITLEETAAIFGMLGNAGLKGSLAGTSFVNMMNKIVDPSEKTTEMMKKWNIVLTDATGKLKPVSTIVNEFATRLDAIPNAATRAALGVEFFGLRGVKAYNALKIQGKAAIDDLQAHLIASSYGIGAANEMAERRLDNFLGKLVLWKSSVESISIGLFGPMLKEFAVNMDTMTDGLNNILFSFNGLREIRSEESKQNSESAILLSKETSERLQSAGATEAQSQATRSAIQVLTRMQMSEEDLTRTQIAARKRGVLETFEVESRRRAELMKTAQIAAAGVKSEAQLGVARTKMMNQQIASMIEARKIEAQKQIDVAFSGAKGSASAQQWLRRRALEEALTSNTDMSVAERKTMAESMDNLIMYEAERSKRADALRAEIFSQEKLQEIESKYGSAAVQIAMGMQDAIDGVIGAWKNLTGHIREFGKTLEEKLGKDGLRTITRYGVYFALIATAIVPVFLALLALSFILGGVGKAFTGLKNIAMGAITIIRSGLAWIAAAFWPILIVVGALAIAFAFYRREGESFSDTMVRLWGDIKNAAMGFYQTVQQVISGFKQRWNEVVDPIKERWKNLWNSIVTRVETTVDKIKERFNRIFGHWFQGTESMKISWSDVGAAIANGIAAASDIVASVVDTIVSVITTAADIITNILEGPLSMVVSAIDTMKINFDSFASDVKAVWASVSETFNTVVAEIKADFNEIIIAIFGSNEQASEAWRTTGKVIGAAILAILDAIVTIVGGIVRIIINVVGTVVSVVKNIVVGIKSAFSNLFAGIVQIIEGDFLGGIKRIGTAIFNALTLPIRAALGGLLKLIRKIPYVEEGLKANGVDINSIQKWLDEGISYEGTNEKGKLGFGHAGNVTTAGISIAESAKGSVRVTTEKHAKDYRESDIIRDKKSLVDAIGDAKTRQQQKALETPQFDATVNLEDNRTLDIKNSMCVDGENMDVATSRHKREIQDRAGYKSTPWQRRSMAEHGVVPSKRAAG